ncbi:exopolyphosphatase [Aliiglaciecola sp. CAU 1673]|uniref:exopolyphosphatase n=1 Tax=Aliiglaciecola sp. CAU 1673 TaxID=3032595 RepID=UPI0023DA5DE0|nr:exopolyphosphatase [Aliiglaciecola sp. CAU 1673]MDF2179429.1 exopolyphosphatase [Aliiglaciecola sp. CAU 1673]
MIQLAKAFSEIESRDTTHVAALDIGSNSFHLVVARIVAGSVQILFRVKQRVRLADGLDSEGNLAAEAIERGIEALQQLADSLRGFNPDSVRIVATYTLRKARNAHDFIRAARRVLPYPVEIIAGVEEARLIYQGVAHTTENAGKRLVIDIGGGSTEFIIGTGFKPELLRSLQMGCVSFTQRFFASGELKNKAFNKAITAARQEMEMIDKKYRQLGWDVCIGTSGTIKTIAGLAQEINSNLKPGTFTRSELQKMIEMCCKAEHINKLNINGLSEDRVPVFAAGLAILSACFDSLEIKEMEFSQAALREGVIYEMEERLQHQDIRERTAESLAIRYDVDTDHAKRVLHTTLQIYHQVAEDWDIKHDELHSLLGWAALLHEVGLQINSRGVQRHSGYILQNAELPGFNQEQQNLLASLVRFHRKKIKNAELTDFSLYKQEQILRLICILQLGVMLNIKRQDNFLPKISAKVKGNTLSLEFADGWLDETPLVKADLDLQADIMRACGLSLKFR